MGSFNRYMAQTRVQEISNDGQKLISAASVLIVGAGALGSPVAMYLAGAGVGHIIIADFDSIELSNLHRQVYFSESDAGNSKVSSLQERIIALNSSINVTAHSSLVTEKFLCNLSSLPDLIIDAADNPATTYLLDKFCHEKGLPLVTAGISGWNAQIFTYIPGSIRYSEMFPEPDNNSGILPCSLSGITGSTAAFAASLQCNQALKIIIKKAGSESSLITANLLTNEFNLMVC